MVFVMLVVLATALIGTRPWRTHDEIAFEASALLAAILLSALLLMIA
jgi:hypothetical protein